MAQPLLSEKTLEALVQWFKENQRPWPWRKNKDPYRIWISEVMLQQTTSTAVKPFYERFMNRFPKVEDLARASLEDVYEMWSGLGYYSRARNLHKAAQQFHELGFPRETEKLLNFPGLGPYTARAVASLAFGERVGVIDGNVIRVLSRISAEPREWWKTAERKILQEQVDALCQSQDPYWVNQGLMELGATICLPKNPACLLCPVRPECRAYKKNITTKLPLAKPKRDSEVWEWLPQMIVQGQELAVLKSEGLPFLRNHLVFPGRARRLSKPPEKFDFKHNITHHEIYVTLTTAQRKTLGTLKEWRWVSIKDLRRESPTSIMQKVLQRWQDSPSRGSSS